jgi:hypothetical protein
MISRISDFDSVYQIRRRLGQGINGHPIQFQGKEDRGNLLGNLHKLKETRWCSSEIMARRDVGGRGELAESRPLGREREVQQQMPY